MHGNRIGTIRTRSQAVGGGRCVRQALTAAERQKCGENRAGSGLSIGGPTCAPYSPRSSTAEDAVMVIVLMGVSGSGKTTVGKVLAAKLGWSFADGDDYHPSANIEKLRAGAPLTDNDRQPWLAALRVRLDMACMHGENIVLACSALKHAYQDYLERHDPDCIHYVYLQGSEELIRQRLATRTGHFMNPNLLHSQFETLEPPSEAIRVDVVAPPAQVAEEIERKLGI